MVNVTKGVRQNFRQIKVTQRNWIYFQFFQVLVECDPVMKQFLLHLDEKLTIGTRFVIQDLDERRLFISADALEQLQEKIDDLMDKISVPVIAHDQ